VEAIVTYLQSLDPLPIYLLAFSIAFIENIFPPSPSDVVIVFTGSMVGIGRVNFAETLLITTLGSTAGFVVMFKAGHWFGSHILETGRISFIPVASVKKVEAWFHHYGYWIIIVNRFLSGTRAVVSFVAGMSEMNLLVTTILCFLSALAWNAILISGGWYLGSNWQRIGIFLDTYSEIVTGVVVLAALVWTFWYLSRRNGAKKTA
jgi:membrane protein DedA with SNARE-associated domain